MDWSQDFEYHLFFRLLRKHKIQPISRLGIRLLEAARREKKAAEESGAPAKYAASLALDTVVMNEGMLKETLPYLTLKRELQSKSN